MQPAGQPRLNRRELSIGMNGLFKDCANRIRDSYAIHA